jgi:hypothetical protein
MYTYRFAIANNETPTFLPLLMMCHATQPCQRGSAPEKPQLDTGKYLFTPIVSLSTCWRVSPTCQFLLRHHLTARGEEGRSSCIVPTTSCNGPGRVTAWATAPHAATATSQFPVPSATESFFVNVRDALQVLYYFGHFHWCSQGGWCKVQIG